MTFCILSLFLFAYHPLSCMAGSQFNAALKKSDMCGPPSWTYYEPSEKCFTTFDTKSTQTLTYEETMAECRRKEITSALPTIDNSLEEEFIVNLVQNSVQNEISLTSISIGVEKTFINSTQHETSEGEMNDHQNSEQCLRMRIDSGNGTVLITEWSYISQCQEINFIVCQKVATWAPSKIQKKFLNHKQESVQNEKNVESKLIILNSTIGTLAEKSKSIDSLQSQLNSARIEMAQINSKMRELIGQIDSLKNSVNSVPIGFIYIQYYGQSAPSSLWPNFSWAEITSTYAGQFFRAQGQNSAAFGTTQSENSPRITQIDYEDHENHPVTTSLPVGGRSASVRSGNWNGNGDKVGLVFTTSAGEIRPYNSAIKIWKRVS